MRIWDINPGYLSRQHLLGEHRELHAIVSILRRGRRGYSRHPETLRWTGHGWALRQRHRLLAAEMRLRGFDERSPVNLRTHRGRWPERYLDSPCAQYVLLAAKYQDAQQGRIPLPHNIQQLAMRHKEQYLMVSTALGELEAWL